MRLSFEEHHPGGYLWVDPYPPLGLSSMDVADCLRRVPLLQGLDPESIALLATHTRSVSFPANAMIVERGEVGVPLFVVLEGRAGVTDPPPVGSRSRRLS